MREPAPLEVSPQCGIENDCDGMTEVERGHFIWITAPVARYTTVNVTPYFGIDHIGTPLQLRRCGRVGVLYLDPIRTPARLIGRIAALRPDAFQSKRAGVPEYRRAE